MHSFSQVYRVGPANFSLHPPNTLYRQGQDPPCCGAPDIKAQAGSLRLLVCSEFVVSCSVAAIENHNKANLKVTQHGDKMVQKNSSQHRILQEVQTIE